MVRIRGFSANLNPQERINVKDLVRFLGQFEGKVVFVYNRAEVQLHGIRFSAAAGEVQFLLKDVKSDFS